jgi:hypothetical protein
MNLNFRAVTKIPNKFQTQILYLAILNAFPTRPMTKNKKCKKSGFSTKFPRRNHDLSIIMNVVATAAAELHRYRDDQAKLLLGC